MNCAWQSGVGCERGDLEMGTKDKGVDRRFTLLCRGQRVMRDGRMDGMGWDGRRRR